MKKQIEEIGRYTAKVSHSECALKRCEDCKWCGEGDGKADCMDYLIAEHLYNAGYRKQVWHDVSEPPKTSGLYIVCTDKGSVFTAHYYADCGRFNAPFKKSVVRWTEMPEAPKGE